MPETREYTTWAAHALMFYQEQSLMQCSGTLKVYWRWNGSAALKSFFKIKPLLKSYYLMCVSLNFYCYHACSCNMAVRVLLCACGGHWTSWGVSFLLFPCLTAGVELSCTYVPNLHTPWLRHLMALLCLSWTRCELLSVLKVTSSSVSSEDSGHLGPTDIVVLYQS